MEREWNENKTNYNSSRPLFEDLYGQPSISSNKISVERLNTLFDEGYITAKEYSFLLRKLYPFEKKTSYFAWASLLVASLNWILMLKFTFNDDVYELLSGSGRLTAGTILAPLSLIFFLLAVKEIRKHDDVKGFEIAIAGLTLATALLTIVIPTQLMTLFR